MCGVRLIAQDVNKNNVITYTEFIAAVLEMHGKIEEYRFAEAFDQLNCDDSGYSTYFRLFGVFLLVID